MRLTRQTNYALRMLMYCAANEGKLSRVQEIAKANSISETFTFKILQVLVSGGLVTTVRGRNGGIRLARPAAEITVLEVVQITEDNFAMAECFEDDHPECPLVDNCALNGALREALGAFFQVLSGYTIDDLARPRSRLSQLFNMERTDPQSDQDAPEITGSSAA